MRLSAGVPEEFQNLLYTDGEGGPERLGVLADGQFYLELYVEGDRRGNALVTLEQGRLVIEAPEKIAAQIPDLRRQDKFIISLARGRKPGDEGYCIVLPQSVCNRSGNGGRLELIVDTDRQRLDIFRSAYFIRPPLPLRPSHPDAVGMIANLTGRISGVSGKGGDDLSGALAFDLVGGRGPDSFFALGAVTDDGHVALYRGGVQAFRGRWRAAAGPYLSNRSDILRQTELVGVELHTTELTRRISRTAVDSPITVFLGVPSYVDVFRGEELIYSGYGQAGAFAVPTARFPDGSYSVDIVLRGEDGITRQESQFFSRSQDGASRDRKYAFQLGVTRAGHSSRQRSDDEQLYASALMESPLGARSVAGIRVGALGETAFLETSLARAMEKGQLRLSGYLDSRGGTGAAAQVAAQMLGISVNARARYENPGRTALQGPFRARARRLEATLNASAPVPRLGGTLSTYGRIVNEDSQPVRSGFGVSWNRSVRIPETRMSLQYGLGYQHTDEDERYLFSLRLSQTGKSSSMSARTGLRFARTDEGEATFWTREANWTRRSSTPQFPMWSLGARLSQNDEDAARIGLSGQLRARRFIADARMDHALSSDGSTNYFAMTSTSLALTPYGAAMSGDRAVKAGVLIDLRQEETGVRVQAGAGAARRRDIRKGLTFIPTQAFQPQSIRMRPVAKGPVAFDGAPIEVRAFPGNVIRIAPGFFRQVSIFGRVVDQAGRPVSGIKILQKGKDPYRVDESGYFVLDIRADARTLTMTGPDDLRCEFLLADKLEQSARGVVDLGTLVCTGAGDPVLFAEG